MFDYEYFLHTWKRQVDQFKTENDIAGLKVEFVTRDGERFNVRQFRTSEIGLTLTTVDYVFISLPYDAVARVEVTGTPKGVGTEFFGMFADDVQNDD